MNGPTRDAVGTRGRRQNLDLEVIFDQKPGYFRETENDQVMEKVDDEGNVGFVPSFLPR
jgi:hypothetical protein